MFKRRTPKSWALWFLHLVWPQGGWARAAHYVKHRVRRLPDDPGRIARGIFAGVFTTFTPFYGFHFFIAAGLAKVMRGNILAALMSTFFGNPLTYLPIGVISLKTGHFLLGTEFEEDMHIGHRFAGAWRDLKHNFWAMFNENEADWHRLSDFYDEVFFPYMIGGLIPGVLFGLAAYVLSRPLIAAYQNRRRGRIKAKLDEIKQRKAAAKAAKPPKPGKAAREPSGS
ncbi:hypothetical protein C8N43_1970 [Litoreibacter ponti]|uniref:DUF2062 domain-containing protein n=1 Tax=Litoreibacter ponti TaxID=1510457 RepID=A0A2T6BMJ7_9RHOB|nr:DUF2062 domain-containing protein [Litoreibacter ponti]PTX57303.1 hypothetical protein C8N43_1970 [Litoreibacter ponti]